MRATSWIYAMKEPDSDEVRYVGASVKPLVRFRDHLSAHSYGAKAVRQWVAALKERGLEPELVLLEEVEGQNMNGHRPPEIAEAEDRWIVRLIDEGHRLLNARLPGDKNRLHQRDERLMREAIERGRRMFGEAE